jgi:hypothetical protein
MHERHGRYALFGALAAMSGSGCAPPPPIDLGQLGGDQPSLEITWPLPGATIELDSTCVLTETIVVDVENFELVPLTPDMEDVDGQGHWHGGPDLSQGYCLGDKPFCSGGANNATYETYDGSAMTAGLLTLYAELNSNLHEDLGIGDQVEVELTDPGHFCDADPGT